MRTPKVYQVELGAFESETLEFVSDVGKTAKYCEIINSSADNIACQLNGDSGAVLTVWGNTSQLFRQGDITIREVELTNSGSGDVYCEVIIAY